MSLIDKLFDSQVKGLTRSMDLGKMRNNAIASNIANADTPGYRAVDVNFSGELEKAFQTTSSKELSVSNPKHFASSAEAKGGAHLTEDLSGATKADGNNVDVDIQMGQMSFNAGRYSSAANLLRKKLAYLKMVVREGGR